MHARRSDDGALRERKLDGMEDERPRLRPSNPAVERDQLLERAALVEVGVVEAPDHDVGDMRERVRPQQVEWRSGREVSEGVVALSAVLREEVDSICPEGDRPTSG